MVVITLVVVNCAQAQPGNFVSYLTSWGASTIDLNHLSPKVTALNLAFVNIDSATLRPVGSDGMLDAKSGTGWKQAAYNIWTQYKYTHKNVRVLLSFGGATYADLWTSTLTAANAAQIAHNIAVAVNVTYPVYQFDAQYVAHVVGNVSLDGVDLDVEGGGVLTQQQATNVVLLIQALRQELPSKLITLTGLSTAADPASCATTKGPDCSYFGSPHSGEILPVLTQVSGLIDWVNDMAYDAGKNYNYQLSLGNYAKYIVPNRINLGLDLEKQWGPSGDFVESLSELTNRAKWAGINGYGSMDWALGASSGYAVDKQLDVVNQLAEAFN